MIELGFLESVPIREIWAHEAIDFTPWLAEPVNMARLAKALNLGDLEVEATEKNVGRFSADIVARDKTDELVLIENQLEPTDHRHLGQVLTYLAGLEGNATIVWIASKLLDEHRAAIDWLNINTNDNFDFFGVELEVLKIGNSNPAPRFNVVAKPNNWSRHTRAIASGVGGGTNAAYWLSFSEYLKKNAGPEFLIRRPSNRHFQQFKDRNRIGKGVEIQALISSVRYRHIGVLLALRNKDTKEPFNKLLAQKEAIEKEFGEALEWDARNDGQWPFISVFLKDVDPADSQKFPELHEWMLKRMDRFKNVFRERIKNIGLDSAGDEGSEMPDE